MEVNPCSLGLRRSGRPAGSSASLPREGLVENSVQKPSQTCVSCWFEAISGGNRMNFGGFH